MNPIQRCFCCRFGISVSWIRCVVECFAKFIASSVRWTYRFQIFVLSAENINLSIWYSNFIIFSIWQSMINSCWKNLYQISSDNFGAKPFHWFMIWPNSIDDKILWCNCTNWYFERGPCKQFVWRQHSKLAFTAARPSMTWQTHWRTRFHFQFNHTF